MDDFLIFLLVGFLAQVVDGALGMAYGVIASTVLLGFGVGILVLVLAIYQTARQFGLV